LGETIYVSKRRYDVECEETLNFIDKVVLPYVEVLPMGLSEHLRARELTSKLQIEAIRLNTRAASPGA